jgi:hypothetical protein
MYKLKQDIDFWVGVIGTAASGTLNTLIEVTTAANVTQFGAVGGGTLVSALNTLLKYGAKIIAVRVATGADATATAANIVGTDLNTGLGLLSRIEAQTSRYPIALVVPGIQNDSVITALNTRAIEAGTLGIAGWLGTETDLNTARATAANYGLKSKNLAITYPVLASASGTEYMTAHLAGLLVHQFKYGALGVAPVGRKLRDIISTTPASSTAPATANGVIKARSLGNNQFDLAGYLNASAPTVTGQEALLVRIPVEGILTREIRAFLAGKIGLSINIHSALLVEMEITNLLNNHAATGSIKHGYAKFNQQASTFPTDGSDVSLVYDICVSLVSGFVNSTSITFTLVL